LKIKKISHARKPQKVSHGLTAGDLRKLLPGTGHTTHGEKEISQRVLVVEAGEGIGAMFIGESPDLRPLRLVGLVLRIEFLGTLTEVHKVEARSAYHVVQGEIMSVAFDEGLGGHGNSNHSVGAAFHVGSATGALLVGEKDAGLFVHAVLEGRDGLVQHGVDECSLQQIYKPFWKEFRKRFRYFFWSIKVSSVVLLKNMF